MKHQKHTPSTADFPQGRAAVTALIVGGFALFFVAAFFFFWLRQTALVRDVQRLADMRTVQSSFLQLYTRTGSFRDASRDACDHVGDAIALCVFPPYGNQLATVQDPGHYAYAISVVPDTTFAVTFRLEQRHGTLAAGKHTVTPEGIH